MKTHFGDWTAQKYPYDLAECGFCLSDHASIFPLRCNIPEHREMRAVARDLKLRPPQNFNDDEMLFRFNWARRVYADLYPTEVA